jgi:predicted nucleic acid-binding protein
LTPDEVTFRDTLPLALGAGERECVAIAKDRSGVVLSNESRVAHCCRQYGIACLRLPDILRALWVEAVISKQEVREIISDLQIKDRMQFKQSTLEAILAD